MIRRPIRRVPARDSLVFLALVLLGLALPGCGRDAASENAAPAPAVEAVPARYGSLPLRESLSGVVRARNQVAIRPEVEGPVAEVFVRNGDAVARGDVLVRLGAGPLRERLRQAEAALRSAEANASEARARLAESEARTARARTLAEQQLLSPQDLETREAQAAATRAQSAQAEAGVEEARATVEERREDLAKTTIRAPVPGRVGRRDVEVGMIVDPGSTLFVLGDLDDLVAEVPLTERLLGSVDVGTPVLVDAAALEEGPIRAELSRISPFLETSSFSTTAEIDLEDGSGRLRPGMFVRVEILYGETESATILPASAVWEDPRTGRRGIYVVRDAAGLVEPEQPLREIPPDLRELVFRPTEVIAEGGGLVGVTGVDEGEWVVTMGQQLLRRETREEEGAASEATGSGTSVAGAETAPIVSARVRPTSWTRVTELQSMQREDLLAEFLDKQRRLAAALGTEIPESETIVQRVLAGEAPPAASKGEGG